MMIDLANGYEITDVKLPTTALRLTGDKKNLLIEVTIKDVAQLAKPVVLSSTVIQKLLTDMTTILPEDLANTGLLRIEQSIQQSGACVSFSFDTPVHETHVTVTADHLLLALNTMLGSGLIG